MTTTGSFTPLAERLAKGLDQSVADGHLPASPATGADRHGGDTPAYIRAVRTRLIDLGYLGESEHNRGSPTTDPLYTQAVKRFQSDAGLVDATGRGDGWAGPVTWQLLQCLVSFESDQDPRHWPVASPLTDNPAIHRASYLRLYAMGFFEDWAKHKANTRTIFSAEDNPAFAGALARFVEFAVSLDLLPIATPAILSQPVLQLLFGHDQLLAAIAARRQAQPLFDRYQQQLAALVRIELWMQGYDVAPGGEKFKKLTRPPRAGLRRRRQKVSTTVLAIRAFWRDNAVLRGRAGKDTLSQALFRAFTSLTAGQQDTGPADLDIARQVDQLMANKRHRSTLKQSFAQLASGIWDGLKRVMGWLTRMVTRALRITREFISNLARFVARKARVAFPQVSRAIAIVHRGLCFGLGDATGGNRHGHIYISKARDFDHWVIVDPNAAPGVLTEVMTRYRHDSRCYQAATRLLSRLFYLLKAVLAATTRAWGWLQVLLSLSRLAGNIRAIKGEIEAMAQFQHHPPSLTARI